MIVSLPLALAFAFAAAFSAGELLWQHGKLEIVSYVADREAQATHLLMNGGMAAMFAPFYTTSWATGLQAVYALTMAVLLVRLACLHGKRPSGRGAGTVYHIVGLVAMIWSIRVMADAMPSETAGLSHMMAMPPHGSWIGVVLAVAFALDGIATALLAAFAPGTIIRMALLTAGETHVEAISGPSMIRAVRIAAVPHIVMDVGMVLMLWPLASP